MLFVELRAARKTYRVHVGGHGADLRVSFLWAFGEVRRLARRLRDLWQEVPRQTNLHSRGSTRVAPTSRGAPVPPPSSSGGIVSLRVRERIPGIPVASQEEALSTGKARGTLQSSHHFQSAQDVSVHSRKTCFSCTASTFKPRIGSHHGGTWDSPLEKPRGKATDPITTRRVA